MKSNEVALTTVSKLSLEYRVPQFFAQRVPRTPLATIFALKGVPVYNIQYVALYQASTSIRPLKTKTQFLQRPL